MAKKRKARTPVSAQITVPSPQEQVLVEPKVEAEEQQPPVEQIEEPTKPDELQVEDVVEGEEEDDEEEGEGEGEGEGEEEEDDPQANNGGEQALVTDSSTDVKEANGGGDGGEKSVVVEEDLEDEPVEKLLEPFSKEQLVLLLKEAVAKYPQFIDSVQKIADADPAHRKIFVHGLGWDTNAETLTSEFGKYGEIEDCKAVVDKVSGKSKGYGFILFKHRSGAQKALREPQKKIGNRMTSCQLASAGPIPAPPPTAPPVSEYTQRKIFVSNVAADIDPQKLLEYFSKYGEIEDGPLGLDKASGKPKGFALFVYKSVESARKALEEPHKTFDGHTLHCQKAIDGPKPNKPYFQPQQPQPHHHHHQQPHQHSQYHHHSKKTKYSSGGGGGPGHLMAPSGPTVGYNSAVTPQALTPALGQALSALLATQGAGLGISNLLGGLGAPVNPQGMPPVMSNTGYGNQSGYGVQQMQQGGYQNPQMGQGGNRPQQGGGSYMGHGH